MRTIGHYALVERLGSGGMGEVYRATDTRLGREVAIKLLPESKCADAASCARLLAEARAAARLAHPGLATVHEVGEEGGRFFVVMELVDGDTLASRLRGGRLRTDEALAIAIEIAEALDSAHQQGVLHCDLTPRNVMITREGRVKVLDFGLARRRTGGSPLEVAGAPTEIGGTAASMSPEQIRGEELDERTDVLALGVVLYEMLAGASPFARERKADTLDAVLHAEPRPLSAVRPDVPLRLEGLIRGALEKERSERFPSMRTLLEELRAVRRELLASMSASHAAVAEGRAAGEAAAPSPRVRGFSAKVPAAFAVAAAAFAPTGLLWWLGVGQWYSLAAAAVGTLVLLIWARHRRRRLPAPAQPRGAGVAFRGLQPFLEADRDRFFGREEESGAVTAMITDRGFRFGVLYGDSGCGKTSLLRAGVMPRLWELGFIPLYCRAYRAPLEALVAECRRITQVPPDAGEAPADYLRRVAELHGAEIVAVFDQFEELFTGEGAGTQDGLVGFVGETSARDDVPLRFLFAVRSDFLYRIADAFDGRIADPLVAARRYHLRNLDEQAALAIITQSAAAGQLALEERLARQVARDLAAGGRVLPSELQVVGEQLQGRHLVTLAAYRAAGGKEALLHDFLEDVLAAARDRGAAALALRAMISDEDTRLNLPAREIARRTERPFEEVAALLRLFVQARLVRESRDEEPRRYELVHEYLIPAVNAATGRVLDAAQRARRLLRQYLSSFSVDPSVRIPLRQLWQISRFADLRRDPAGRLLARRSLVAGLVRWSAAAAFGLVLVAAAVAALSVREEWQARNLREGHGGAVRQIAFSPGERVLISGGEDGRVIVWDFPGRRVLASLGGHSGLVRTVAYSPDGSCFASGGADRRLVIWDAQTHARRHEIQVETVVQQVAFSPDGRKLVAALKTLTVFDPVAGVQLDAIRNSAPQQWALQFIRGGRWLAALQELAAWDLEGGRHEKVSLPVGLAGNFAALSAAEDSGVAVDSNGVVRFWHAGRDPDSVSFPAHLDHGRCAAISPDGRLAATAAEDIVLWDAVTPAKLARFQHGAIVWTVAFTRDARYLVSGHADGSILVWDVEDRRRAANLTGHAGPVTATAFSRSGRLLATGGEDRSVIVWDADGSKRAVFSGHRGRVTCVAWVPDGSAVAVGDQFGDVTLWDLASRSPRWVSAGQPEGRSPVAALAISVDGNLLADSRQSVLDVRDGRELGRAEGRTREAHLYGLTFLRDGRLLGTTFPSAEVMVWQAPQWRLLESASVWSRSQVDSGVHLGLIGVSLSPDQRWLATAGDDGAVHGWGLDPLRPRALLGRHMGRARAVAVLPDGKRVASGGDDHMVYLWDAARSRLVASVGTHGSSIFSLAAAPDGRLAVGDGDGGVRVFTPYRTVLGVRSAGGAAAARNRGEPELR